MVERHCSHTLLSRFSHRNEEILDENVGIGPRRLIMRMYRQIFGIVTYNPVDPIGKGNV
jgi:hypothetical protein